jgi:hypothetical protein
MNITLTLGDFLVIASFGLVGLAHGRRGANGARSLSACWPCCRPRVAAQTIGDPPMPSVKIDASSEHAGGQTERAPTPRRLT